MKKHKVRSFHWHHGSLKVCTQLFESLEAALAHVELLVDRNSAKIYDEDGELVMVFGCSFPTYA